MRVTVMGLGLFGGGAGAARFFAEAGHEVTVTDLRDEEALAPATSSLSGLDVRYVLGRHDEADFRSCDLLVVNPAVKPENRFVGIARSSGPGPRGARVTTELELGLEEAAKRRARVLAVTGTNGKSTTAGMLASIMKAHDPRTRSGGNLGGSLLLEAGSIPEGAPLVLEVSSFQLHRLDTFPGLDAAVVTNLSPNHLDWHGSVEAYYAAKHRLLEFLPSRGVVVLNGENEILRRWRSEFRDRPGGLFKEADVEGLMLGLASEHIAGGHDVMNWAAARLAARFCGVSEDEIEGGLRTFRRPRGRLEVVARAGGIVFVNDSASTTPESAIAALRSKLGGVALIAGGSDKGLSFDALGRAITEMAAAVFVLGSAGKRIAEAVRASDPGFLVREAPDLAAAVKKATGFLRGKAGTVLLSPAAASFDEFRNYEERGERFAELAREWARRNP